MSQNGGFMKIKICGLTREYDIDFVNEARPDYIGFVFAKSKRQVSHKQAHLLKNKLDEGIIAVGVFVDEDPIFIERLVNNGTIDMVQLHGTEDNNYIQKLRDRVACKIIKALNPKDFNKYDVDYLLYDSGAGGTGKPFDWDTINNTPDRPFFLAGGLNIQNIDEARSRVNPYGVDISSGVEINGYKDKNKILEIVRRVHDEKR